MSKPTPNIKTHTTPTAHFYTLMQQFLETIQQTEEEMTISPGTTIEEIEQYMTEYIKEHVQEEPESEEDQKE